MPTRNNREFARRVGPAVVCMVLLEKNVTVLQQQFAASVGLSIMREGLEEISAAVAAVAFPALDPPLSEGGSAPSPWVGAALEMKTAAQVWPGAVRNRVWPTVVRERAEDRTRLGLVMTAAEVEGGSTAVAL